MSICLSHFFGSEGKKYLTKALDLIRAQRGQGKTAAGQTNASNVTMHGLIKRHSRKFHVSENENSALRPPPPPITTAPTFVTSTKWVLMVGSDNSG